MRRARPIVGDKELIREAEKILERANEAVKAQGSIRSLRGLKFMRAKARLFWLPFGLTQSIDHVLQYDKYVLLSN